MRSILLTSAACFGFSLLVGCGGGATTPVVTPEVKAKQDAQHAEMQAKVGGAAPTAPAAPAK